MAKAKRGAKTPRPSFPEDKRHTDRATIRLPREHLAEMQTRAATAGVPFSWYVWSLHTHLRALEGASDV